MDKAKQALNQARDRAGQLAEQHGDKIDRTIDKSTSYLDERTQGKYTDKISRAGDGAKNVTDRLAAGQGDAGFPPLGPTEPDARGTEPHPVDPPGPRKP